MFPHVFEIDPLAKIIFAFIPECQLSYWIEYALLAKNVVALDLMRWTACLLNPVVFRACCKMNKFESLLAHHTCAEIGAWLSNQKEVQSFLMSNIEFKPIFILLQYVTTWTVKFPNFVLDVLSFDATTDMYTHFLSLVQESDIKMLQRVLNLRSATKEEDIALIAELLPDVTHDFRWSADMLHFLCGCSPIIQARIVQMGLNGCMKLIDEAALEAMYVNGIWDKGQQRANFQRARDFQTIAILFRPEYKLHPKHCVELIDTIVLYHTLSSETACKFLQALWMYEPDPLSLIEFLSLAFLNMVDPLSPYFLAMFPTPSTFLMRALEHHSPVAIDWGIDNLQLAQDDINTFVTACFTNSHFFYVSMNRIVKRWPCFPKKIIIQLAQYALTNWSWTLLDVLIRQKHIDHTFVETLSEVEWLSLANAPQHIIKSLWCDTDIWRKHHAMLFRTTLHNSASPVFLWRKNNIIDPNLLIEYTCTLFCNEDWDILSTIVADVPNRTIMVCYRHFAREFSDAKCEFLKRNWPLNDPNKWIKLLQIGCERFQFYCWTSGHISSEHLLQFLLHSTNRYKFLRKMHFDLDFHDQSHVQLFNKCF